ncbi:glycosyltransferase family 39 protein [Companilactobacillus mishanensis]|uniref:glycosyltransferase family 39 protein n=1 Tax=Companilactobacillus mishanensis TaxID=2486008 RepID=UPI001296E4CC|nr:glycosyltransferase family 39 protein [Companilactobacillus mishanensis]MQS88237.1 hypothetical protein [Companilactobacillus mishanensis]
MNRPEITKHPTKTKARHQFHRFKIFSTANHLTSTMDLPLKKSTVKDASNNKKKKAAAADFDTSIRSSAGLQSLKLAFQSASILISIGLLIFMSLAAWGATKNAMHNYWQVITFTMVTLLIFGLCYAFSNLIGQKSFMFFVGILLVIALIKIFFISIYAIHPTSDFFNYHYFAFARSSGIAWTKKLVGVNMYFPHVMNIAMFYSIPYSLIGTNYVTSQIVNIALTFFDGILIYKICLRIFNQQAGMFAALIFSLIPAYFMYSTLNGAEPMFITAFLGMLLAFQTFIRRDNSSSSTKWVASFRDLAILSVITYMIRPTIGIWIIVGFLYILLIRWPYKVPVKFQMKRLLYFGGFTLFFVLFSIFSSAIFSQAYKINFASDSVNNRYSLATGTSLATDGQYNQKIYNKLDKDFKDSSSTAEINQKATKDMNAQVKANISEVTREKAWPKFISNKYAAFSNENYGYNWILYNTWNKNKLKKSFVESQSALVSFSTIFYEFMIILSILTMSLILLFRHRVNESMSTLNRVFYLSLLLDGFILGSMIFEVQGRYHVILYIPLVMILGLGAKILGERQNHLTVRL